MLSELIGWLTESLLRPDRHGPVHDAGAQPVIKWNGRDLGQVIRARLRLGECTPDVETLMEPLWSEHYHNLQPQSAS